MRGVWPHEQDEERAFADKAAKHFAQNPGHFTYGGDLNPGTWLALRWGAVNDCVVVLKISEDHTPVNYYELVKKYTLRPQVQFRELAEALSNLVKWHGKRHDITDELLPAGQQSLEIARAMSLVNEDGDLL